MILEEMIALGAKKIIFIGGVGVLNEHIIRGDLIIPNRAIRDDGVSYQYEPPSLFSYPSHALKENLYNALDGSGLHFWEGATWTTSSVFRETQEKLELFRSKGAICVETEAASLFSVARFRDVQIAGLFIAGDSIAANKWSSQKKPEMMPGLRKDREGLLKLALEALSRA